MKRPIFITQKAPGREFRGLLYYSSFENRLAFLDSTPEETMNGGKKTVIEKLTDAVKDEASTIAEVASNAAEAAMKSTTESITPDKSATINTGAIFVPEAVGAAAMPISFTIPVKRKRSAKKTTAKKTAKKAPKKTAKNNSRKKAAE